jgi:ligand-binding SRPBCC domain-containing protein
METYHLQTEIWLARPRRQVFEFFADPRNLERITPPWLSFEIVTPPDTRIETGTVLEYRLRLRRLPLRWRSEIAAWEPPRRFVDRQIKGPYSLWVHEHRFEECDDGTVVIDRVEYAVPGGRLVQRFLVAPDLKEIFRYRHGALSEIFNRLSPATPP